ncbi:MAG: class I SAM-dependent methyltransferase [Acidobacteria bacterium]|nr:class I SAM-dependent methyltransferase [Acidobacteriota bacterium]
MGDAEFDDLELNYAAWLPADRAAAILDVGCGGGRVLAFLESRGYTRAEGFDREAGAIDAARARVRAPLALEDDWRRFLEPRAGAFDLIILKDVIYYLPRDRVVDHLREVRAALAPHGRVIVEVFNGAAYTGPFVALKDDAILWTPTEHTVRRFLERAGLSVVALRGQRAPARTLRRRAFNAAGRLWRVLLRGIYVAERGFSEENPAILTTKIVAVAEVPG